MTSRIPHPYPGGAAARWIAERDALAASGREISFCLDSAGTVAGAVTLRRLAQGLYDLGYWIGKSWWGRGFATAAAQGASAHAFAVLGAGAVRAGHYLDNPASGRVLEKCGFRYTGNDWQWSQARQQIVPCRRYLLQGTGAR
jgi:RimJ/RimL family protein N-acetyltransferase